MTGPLPAVPRFSHEAMGTFFEIFIPGSDSDYAGQAAREAFREIDRLERLFSRFDRASEISRINRLPPGGEIAVGIETFDCLSLAESVRLETDGAFDINARVAGRKGPDGEPAGRPSYPGPLGAAFELIRDAGNYLVRRPANLPPELPAPDLDLGAIGKGYAVDRALEVLRDWGVSDALIHGGTSTALAAGSPVPGDLGGWPVGVGAGWPCAPASVLLSGRALSGSGTEVKGEHILDPRTGRPARGFLAAWASAPSAALSDALSTAFFIMSLDEIEACAGRNPEVWACLVVSYGDVRIFNSSVFPENL